MWADFERREPRCRICRDEPVRVLVNGLLAWQGAPIVLGRGKTHRVTYADILRDLEPLNKGRDKKAIYAFDTKTKQMGGLLLDLGRPVTVTSAQITLGSIPGADVELRAGNLPALADPQLQFGMMFSLLLSVPVLVSTWWAPALIVFQDDIEFFDGNVNALLKRGSRFLGGNDHSRKQGRRDERQKWKWFHQRLSVVSGS